MKLPEEISIDSKEFTPLYEHALNDVILNTIEANPEMKAAIERAPEHIQREMFTELQQMSSFSIVMGLYGMLRAIGEINDEESLAQAALFHVIKHIEPHCEPNPDTEWFKQDADNITAITDEFIIPDDLSDLPESDNK